MTTTKIILTLRYFIIPLCYLMLSKSHILAGPTVHISDLVKMDEAQIDSLLKQGKTTLPNGEEISSITISGVSSHFTSGGIDAVDIEKTDLYEVTDPKLTTFTYGQQLTKDEYDEAVESFKDFGGFKADRSLGYSGFNGLNFAIGPFKGLQNKILIDPINDKMYYTTSIMIPYLSPPTKKNGKPQESRRDAAKGKIINDGGNFFLEQALSLEAGGNGQLKFSSVKASFPDIYLPGAKIEYLVFEIGNDKVALSGQLSALAAIKKLSKNTEIGVEIEFAHGSSNNGKVGLKKFNVEATTMAIPIGTSGAFFQEFGGTIGNIGIKDAPWYFDGRGVVSYGKKSFEIFGRNIYLASMEGGIGFNQNARIELRAKASVLSFDVSSAKMVYSPPANFNVEVRDMPLGGIFFGDLDVLVHNQNFRGNIGARMGVPRGVPIIGGLTLGGVKAGVTYVKDNYFEIRGQVYVVITPEIKSVCWKDCISGSWPHLHGCGWRGCSWHTHYWKTCWNICTPRIPAIKGSVGFSYHSKRSPAFKAWVAGVEQQNFYQKKYDWENPFVYWYKDPEAPGWWVFNQNWDILWAKSERGGISKQSPIDKKGPDKIIDVIVENDLNMATFRINFEKEDIQDLNMALIMPDGKILNLQDGPFPFGYTQQGITGAASFSSEGREAYFMIHNVKAGNYKMVIENPEKLGGIRYELNSQTQSPEVISAINNQIAKGGEILPGSYELSYVAIDDDSPEAEITFMIDKNNSGFDGIKVGGGKLKDFDTNEPFKFDTDHLTDIRPGYYYGLIAVDDGRNPTAYAYTEKPIWVDRDNATKPVTSIRARGGNNKIIIEWDEAEGEYTHYNVHLSKDDQFQTIDHSILVDKNKTSTIINNLENGQPYLVSVVTVDDENYAESAMMEIQRVTPTQIPGSTKPVFISEPRVTATEGYNYTYLPMLYDADEHNSVIRDITKNNAEDMIKTPIVWSLVQAPAGMVIDSKIGIIQWVPNTDQIGSHNIIIAATENVEVAENIADGAIINSTTMQEYELFVTPKWNLSGVNDSMYFASIPELTAIAGDSYEYYPKISSNDEFTIELLSSPHGMEAKDGVITWDVPEDANGGFVHFRATISSTGEDIENRYFLHVESESNRLKVGAELVKVEKIGDKILLGWTGDGKNFQVQKTTVLTKDISWMDLGDPIKGNRVNFISLDDTGEDSEYYRIKVVE